MTMVGEGGRAVKYFLWLLDKSDNINKIEKATYETSFMERWWFYLLPDWNWEDGELSRLLETGTQALEKD